MKIDRNNRTKSSGNKMFTRRQKEETNNNIIIPKQHTCLFNQPFGLGDVLFIEPIVRHYYQLGNKVVIPVISKYLSIQKHFPYIEFVDENNNNYDYDRNCQTIVKKENLTIFPVRFSKEYFNSPYYATMLNKYKMFDFPLDKWRELTFLRHRWKEDKLINKLKLNINSEYTLVNTNFYSLESKNLDINQKGIKMDFIDGYTLLDWCSIIENATIIHTVNTSILFLLETLNLKAKEVHIYSRDMKGFDLKNTEYLRTKKYILHGNNTI